MEDSANLKDFYKSAILAMKKEVQRLNKHLQYQSLLKKYEKRSNKISILKNDLKMLNSATPTRVFSITPCKSTCTKIDSVSILEDRLSDIQEQLDRAKERVWRDEEELETRLQGLDPALYLAVTKFARVSKQNQSLKIQLKKTANQRKILNSSYAKVTSALIKEPSAGQKSEMIENFDRKIQSKEMRIKVLTAMIEQLRIYQSQSDGEVQKIFEKISQKKAEREENQKKIESLERQVQETSFDIRKKMLNPELSSSAAANIYCRGEIKNIQLEIAEKSRKLKDLENEKLLLQMKYLENLRSLEAYPAPKPQRKRLSSSKTHSTLSVAGRTSSRLHNYTPFDMCSKKSSEIVTVLSKEKDNIITKNLLKILEPFAPGQRLTDKIIAFNRSDSFLSQQSIR